MNNTPANIQKYTEASKHAWKCQTGLVFNSSQSQSLARSLARAKLEQFEIHCHYRNSRSGTSSGMHNKITHCSEIAGTGHGYVTDL